MKRREEPAPATDSAPAPAGIPPAGGPGAGGISRRSLIGGAVMAAGLLAFGGATVALGSEIESLRPPGGQDADRFWGACIRCDRCRAACPLDAIGVEGLTPGLIGARLPIMDFREGFCDMCGGDYRCIAACPTGALTSFDPYVDKIGMAVVDEGECQLFGISGTCNAPCIDACEWDALALDENGRLVVDEARCNGCGACEYVCPTSAYRNYDASDRRGINVEVWHG